MQKPKRETSDPQLSARVQRDALKCGPTALARKLGVSRDSVLAVAAGLAVRAGTLALFRQRLAETSIEPESSPVADAEERP